MNEQDSERLRYIMNIQDILEEQIDQFGIRSNEVFSVFLYKSAFEDPSGNKESLEELRKNYQFLADHFMDYFRQTLHERIDFAIHLTKC